MSESFVPRRRLEKILCGSTATPKKRIEKAAKAAMDIAKGAVPLDVFGTVTTDGNGKTVVALAVTAEELYAAAAEGRSLHATTEQGGADLEFMCPIEAFRQSSGGAVVGYEFKIRCDSSGDALFKANIANGSDTVTLTEQ